ncbi:MAG: glycosyltransferase family 2 protein, partial [Candidatus Eremiobacteraeota bacterium]|nr:glycosyltransferase family 2 protein [Candidatus Eremiobacteraeota bacterium]
MTVKPAAFGAPALELAPLLAGIPAVLASEDRLGDAYFEMASRRGRGERFAGMLFIDDPRAAVSQQIAQAGLQEKSRGDARIVLELVRSRKLRVGDRTLDQLIDYPSHTSHMARDCIHLSDVVVVRSFSEYDRYRSSFDSQARFVRFLAPRNLPAGWAYRGQRRSRIALWAPGRSAESLAFFVAALHPLHAELVVIASDTNPRIESRATYLLEGTADAFDAVSDAACVVDVSISDPSWSFAFAERGVPLAFATTGGAHEWVRGGFAYVPWDYRSLFDAASCAVAHGPSQPRAVAPSVDAIQDALESTRPRRAAQTPLVSVVIATYNRPEDLRNNSLRSLLAQTYENLEIIVVNDGGESVAGVAALDPRIRVYDREENLGALRAANWGASQATGKYVQFLA